MNAKAFEPMVKQTTSTKIHEKMQFFTTKYAKIWQCPGGRLRTRLYMKVRAELRQGQSFLYLNKLAKIGHFFPFLYQESQDR